MQETDAQGFRKVLSWHFLVFHCRRAPLQLLVRNCAGAIRSDEECCYLPAIAPVQSGRDQVATTGPEAQCIFHKREKSLATNQPDSQTQPSAQTDFQTTRQPASQHNQITRQPDSPTASQTTRDPAISFLSKRGPKNGETPKGPMSPICTPVSTQQYARE